MGEGLSGLRKYSVNRTIYWRDLAGTKQGFPLDQTGLLLIRLHQLPLRRSVRVGQRCGAAEGQSGRSWCPGLVRGSRMPPPRRGTRREAKRGSHAPWACSSLRAPGECAPTFGEAGKTNTRGIETSTSPSQRAVKNLTPIE